MTHEKQLPDPPVENHCSIALGSFCPCTGLWAFNVLKMSFQIQHK